MAITPPTDAQSTEKLDHLHLLEPIESPSFDQYVAFLDIPQHKYSSPLTTALCEKSGIGKLLIPDKSCAET